MVSRIIEGIVVDDVLEEEEVIENPVIIDEFDDSFEEVDKREILQQTYNEYNDSYIELTELLKSIIQAGEYTEENKTQLAELNDSYDDSYKEITKELDDAKNTIQENKALDFTSSALTNSQDDVFNALTGNGVAQAIYKDEEGKLYINAQFLQTRGMKVVNDDNQTMLSIDDAGNLTTSGDIVGATITGSVLKAMTVNTNEVNITSEDGGMSIEGSTQKFKDKQGTVRILLGKDENGEFVFRLVGKNGNTILIDENGLKQDALHTGIIKAEHITTEVFETINANIKNLTADKITAGELNATKAEIKELVAKKANISDLNASNATIGNLKTDIATINNLLAGNITSENIKAGSITAESIKAGSITAGSGIIANGAIGSAQISSLDASKITAGKIDTSKVEIAGANNHLRIKSNRLQVFQGTGNQAKERVSLGDVNGDGTVYGLRVRGADGRTVLMDENGVKSEGITDGSITNDKISDDANIDGAKININSVISKINEDGTETINGTKIEVDGQALNTKLSTITIKQNEDSEKISQAQSQISANTQSIGLKVDSQTYQTDKKNMTSQMNKNTSAIDVLQGQIDLKVERTDIENAVTDAKNEIDKDIKNLNKRIDDVLADVGGAIIEGALDEAKCDIVKNTLTQLNKEKEQLLARFNSLYTNDLDSATKSSLLNSKNNFVTAHTNLVNVINRIIEDKNITQDEKTEYDGKVSAYSTALSVFTKYLDESIKSITNTKINTAKAEIKLTTDAITQTVSSLSKTVENKADNSQVSTVSNKVASLETNLDGITQRVSSTESTTATLTTKVNNAQNTADSKAKVFTSTPTTPYKIGDLWVQGSTGDVMRCKTARSSGNYVASDWEKASKYTDDTKANAVDGKVTTLQGTVTSTSKKVASLETDLNSITQRVQDTETTTGTLTSKVDKAQSSANSAQSTANSALNTANTNKNNITNLTTRVSTAESKLTKDSLTTTIGKHYTTSSDVDGIVSSKGYQSQSQVQQTVNSLQAKFTSSGGYNLLLNTGFGNGTKNWNVYEATASVVDEPTSPSGKAIKIVNTANQRGIYQFFKPSSTGHYTLSFYAKASSNTTLLCGQENSATTTVSLTTSWQKFTYTFNRTSLNKDAYIFYANQTGTFYIHSVMVEKGELSGLWTPHPNELYDGVTTIDKDGVTVTASNVKSKTSMSANGFKITKTDTNEDVLKVNVDGRLVMKGDIQGSTFSSTSGAFKVLDDGTVDASTLSVDEEISTDTLTVQHINNSKYQQVLDMNVSINISSSAQDSEEFEDGATYSSIGNFLDACPRNLNGYSVTLNLETSLYENVSVDGLNSGSLIINFNGYTIYGFVYLTGEHMRYRLYGNKAGSTGGTPMGSIMPNIGNSQTGGSYSLVIHNTWGFVYDLKIYGGKATGNNIGVRVANWANAYISGVQFINCYNGLRAYNLGRAYLSSSNGTTSNYAFSAYHGGEIILNASNQAGRSGSTSHTSVSNNARIVSTGVTWSSSAVAGSNTNTTTDKTTKTATIKSTLGDSYRTTVYNSWKKDSTVRQGQWSSHGINNGCWFYGSQFEEYKNKDIQKITITIKRQSGGSSGAVTHTLKMHNHATRPSGKPTYSTAFSRNFSLAVNESITITLTSSADINAFKANKGFGLVNNSYYSVCSGSATVKITYKE